VINLASDLDGTIYRGNKLIDGVEEAYKSLIKKNINIIFITNNSSQSPEVLKEKLENLLTHKINIENIVTPLKLFNYYVDKSKYNLYVYGSNNLIKFLERSDYNLVSLDKSDAILIGRKDQLDVNEIKKIIQYVKKGKQIYCLNKDLTYPTEVTELPGNGAVVKILEESLESNIKSFGKPDYFYTQYFSSSKIKIDYVVGDRVDTDIYFANKVNAYSILVTSGIKNFLSEDLADLKLNSFSEIVPFII
jgi:4-nitrophenyl phosphatase